MLLHAVLIQAQILPSTWTEFCHTFQSPFQLAVTPFWVLSLIRVWLYPAFEALDIITDST